MLRSPDFRELDSQADAFVRTAVDQARKTRVRREDHAAALQQASVGLLRAVTELRTGVANMHDYHGHEMAQRLAVIRGQAAASQVHALDVALPESVNLNGAPLSGFY